MKRKVIFPVFLTLAMAIGMVQEVLAITASEYAVVINLSGRQRMLSQKMSKEMLLIAKGVEAEANRTALKATSELFDKTLKGLRDGDASVGLPATQSAIIKKQLAKVETLWSSFRAHVDTVLAGGAVPVEAVAAENLPLLKNMNTAVRLYEKEAKKATGKSAGIVINLAGKQRMLTQKMSKEMLLIALNHQASENKSNLRSTASLFDRTLKGLRDGDADLELPGTKDAAIVAQLDKVAGLWNEFHPLVNAASDIDSKEIKMSDLQKMAKMNLPLLKEMNAAVKMYEKAEQ